MHEALAATPAWVLLAYLVAGVLFILALRGLSSPETSQQGNRFGMIGMLIAVVTTLIVHGVGLPLHTPLAVSQEKPVGQGLLASHDGVHAPCTHCDPGAHWVASAH